MTETTSKKSAANTPMSGPMSAMSNGIGRRVWVSGALAIGLVAGLGGWAAQAKLAGAVVSQGHMVVTGEVKQIQHNDGGVIAEIAVKNGDRVKKGDVLFRLDETQTRVELSIIRAQIDQLNAMKIRLEGEREGATAITFPASIPASITASEAKLFAENLRMLDNHRRQLGLQAEQLADQIQGLDEQRMASRNEKVILLEEIATMEKLLKSGLGKSSDLRGLNRQLVRLDGTIGDMSARIAEAEGQVSELKIKLLSLDQTRTSEAQKDIVGLESKLAELSERAVAAEHRLSRTVMRAPADGIVYDLQVHTIGGVIGSGATVLSLVPDGDDMKVELRVAPVDIDRLYPGQPVRMRLTAFNQRTTPEIDGELQVIGAATSTDKATGQPYYTASAAMDPADLAKIGKKLIPGMPVEVYVQTEERSALSYITKPFTDQVFRAFREE